MVTTPSKKNVSKNKEILAEAIIESEERTAKLRFPEQFRNRLLYIIERKKIFLSGGVLISANTLSNILNFVFSAYVGRILSFSDFSLVGLMGSFYAFSTLFFGPLSLVVNYRSGFLIGKFNDATGYRFWQYIRKYSMYLGIGISLIWLLFTPFLNTFFNTESYLLFISFAAIIFGGFAAGVDKGFLMGRLFFITLSLIVLIEPVLKITSAIVLQLMHLTQFMYITIPFSFFAAFLIGWAYIIRQKPKEKTITATENDISYFPKKFLFVSLMSGLSTLTFVSLDIVLAKHYLTPSDAGKYALISLVGKTVYFIGGLASPFVIPLVSRDLGANKNTKQILYMLLFFTFIFCFISFVCFGILGFVTVPFLLGAKAYSILPYLNLFLFAMMCFTISQIFVTFYQVKKIYSFTFVGFALSILQIILIVLNHHTVSSFVLVMSYVGIANLVVLFLMHIQWSKVQLLEKRMINFSKRPNL